jgi:hypothetical protein
MAKSQKRTRTDGKGRKRKSSPSQDGGVQVDLVPLPAEEVDNGTCAYCGRLGPLPQVITLRARQGEPDEDVLGVFGVCDEDAAAALRFLEQAFDLVFGQVGSPMRSWVAPPAGERSPARPEGEVERRRPLIPGWGTV